MELEKNLINTNGIEDKALINQQNNFLQTTIGKVVNTGLNLGLRALLPDFIEDQIIEIKDALLNNGLKNGVKQAIKSATDLGKSALGIVTGKFENISQAQSAIKSGGLIDSVSEALNTAIDTSVKKNLFNKSVGNIIKNSKNVILDTIEKNIENSFYSQVMATEKLSKYNDNWKQYYKEQNFTAMEKEYKKIKQTLKEILPTENTIKQAREIENIHLLIKNNGQNFNLSKEQLQLAQKLS